MTAPIEPTTSPGAERPTGRAPEERDDLTVASGECDPRLTFANERTFLAWNRTALAVIVGGLAVAQFLKVGFGGAQLLVALPLIALGAVMSLHSYRVWQRNDRALRLGRPLPPARLPRVLVYAVAALAVVAAALAIVQVATR
jgi:putative membrane protein